MNRALYEVVREQGVDEYHDGSRVLRVYLHENEHDIDFYAVLVNRNNYDVEFAINIGGSFSEVFVHITRDFKSNSISQTAISGYMDDYQFGGYIQSTFDKENILSYNLNLIQKPSFGLFNSMDKKRFNSLLPIIENCYKIGTKWFLQFLKDNNL